MQHEPRPVLVEGPGVLDVTVWRQKESPTVHLVNLTDPHDDEGPLREFLPVPAQRVAIRLPEGEKGRRIKYWQRNCSFDGLRCVFQQLRAVHSGVSPCDRGI